jgi:lipid-binding SYLF domain-containing protein
MTRVALLAAAVIVMATASVARADQYDDTIALFKNAGQSAEYFDKSFGYAVFPTIGKGGLGVGGARGTGRVYKQGEHIGDTTMTQLSVGLQAGGQAFSQIVFFEDERALNDFISGDFEMDAGVGAVAITSAAGASAGTAGTRAGASGGKKDATTKSSFHKGLAIFTIVKGGAMLEVSVAGQKFKFKPLETREAKK